MSITREIREFEGRCLKLMGKGYNGLKLLEFGDNYMKEGGGSAKEWYQQKGVKHISIDLNGRRGSLKIDLNYPLPIKWKEMFDVVTNYGTIEHVTNQYQAFKNAHDCCKVGGLIIHALIPIEQWEGHGRYYYSLSYPTKLAKICGYDIIFLKVVESENGKEDLILVCFRKTKDRFISLKEFRGLPIKDTGETDKTGDYSSLRNRIIRKLMGIGA